MEPSEPITVLTTTSTAEDLSPLEQDVLDEYERLAENMRKVLTYLPTSFDSPKKINSKKKGG